MLVKMAKKRTEAVDLPDYEASAAGDPRLT
jgi:hypothetical protein